MTIDDIANQVCAKVNQTETEDLAFARTAAKLRFELIWNDQLWRDAVMGLEHIWNYASLVGQAGFGLLPSSVDRVLAIRTSERPLAAAHQTLFFRINPDQFVQTGAPWEFAELSRCCWMTMGELGATVGSNSTADDGKVVNITYLTAYQERHQVAITLDYNNGNGVQIQPATDDSADTGAIALREIVSITKPETIGRLAITAASAPSESVLPLAPKQIRAPLLCRIRLFPIPSGAVTLRLMVKMRAPTLADDDEIPLACIENALVALLQADMLERERQYAKAAAKLREGVELLQQVKKIETVQMANPARIIPDFGVGCPSDEYQDAGTSWMAATLSTPSQAAAAIAAGAQYVELIDTQTGQIVRLRVKDGQISIT